MTSVLITSWQIDGEKIETVTGLIFLGSKITADGDCSHEIQRCLLFGRKTMTNIDTVLKRRHHSDDKGPYSKSYGFSSSHVEMWELDHKESWVTKNWCSQPVVPKTLESHSDTEIKPVNPKRNKPWISIGNTDAEAETPILRPPDMNSCLIGKSIRPWLGERLRAVGEGDVREWDGWMASLTQWTWVWANSKRQWKTGKPAVLQSMGLWRVGHNWDTEHQIAKGIQYFLKCLLPSLQSLLKYLLKPSAHCLIGMSVFLLLSLTCSLYILDMGSLSDVWIENIFSQMEVCLPQNESFNFDESQCLHLCVNGSCIWCQSLSLGVQSREKPHSVLNMKHLPLIWY